MRAVLALVASQNSFIIIVYAIPFQGTRTLSNECNDAQLLQIAVIAAIHSPLAGCPRSVHMHGIRPCISKPIGIPFKVSMIFLVFSYKEKVIANQLRVTTNAIRNVLAAAACFAFRLSHSSFHLTACPEIWGVRQVTLLSPRPPLPTTP